MALSSPLCIAARLASGGAVVDQRTGDKRWQPLFSAPSLSLVRRLAKPQRRGAARAQLVGSAESKTGEADGTAYKVKEGDTLTSIAKQSKTSVRILAETNKITNVNFLLAGQSIYVPSDFDLHERPASQAVGDDEFPTPRGLDLPPGSLETPESGAKLWRRVIKNVESIDSGESIRVSPAINIPMLAVAVLLVAPLLGFCIRCIVDTIYLQVDRGEATQTAEMEALEVMPRPKAQRWQKILEADRDSREDSDSEDTDGLTATGASAESDSRNQETEAKETNRESSASETDEEVTLRHTKDYEDIRNSYAELESSYMKFLVDSGMSKSGYWRGSGMSASARLDDSERG